MTTETTAAEHHRITTIIVLSLIMGVLLFAGVAWWINQTATHEEIPITHPLVLSWLLVAGGSIFGASYFRQQLQRRGVDRRGVKTDVSPATVQTRVITMWALVEGACLMGLVVYFVYGVTQLFSATLGYVAVAAIIFFPRREWFGLS